ncbi:MAG: RNA polymerase sigma factor [Phycisphaerales bacterium]
MAESVLKRIAAGDASAVQECIDQYSGLVWSLARRFCHAASDAEDVVQEIFIDLWKNAERFDESLGAESTFVAMIARRRLIDSNRKTGRREKRVTTSIEVPESATHDTIQQDLEVGADAKAARDAIEELRPEQREVLQLAVGQGWTHTQIAEHTGLPLGTVKTHVRRGLMKVRERLHDADAGPQNEDES